MPYAGPRSHPGQGRTRPRAETTSPAGHAPLDAPRNQHGLPSWRALPEGILIAPSAFQLPAARWRVAGGSALVGDQGTGIICSIATPTGHEHR